MERHYTIKYGDLIDGGIIAAADLPAAWSAFPVTIMPNGDEITFTDMFYSRYRHRQIAGDTIPTFLSFLESTTFELLEMLPDGIYHNLLGAAVTVESNEERKLFTAPDGNLDTAYIVGGERITRKREYESELERAEHLLKDGKPLNVWICDRYENCFLGVY